MRDIVLLKKKKKSHPAEIFYVRKETFFNRKSSTIIHNEKFQKLSK